MRVRVLVVALFFSAAVVGATCPPKNLTKVARIRTFGCNLDGVNPLTVKIADNIWDATRVPGTSTWEVKLTQQIDALNYPVTIQPGQGLNGCCQKATEKPVPDSPEDCYVEYTVSCDKPEWGINIASAPQLTFDYERNHPDGLNGWACSKTAPVSGTVTGFGASDQVRLLLRLHNISVLNYPISLSILQQKPTIPLTRQDLERLIDAEANQAAVNDTPAARVAIQSRKKLLPESITLTKLDH